MLAFARLIRSVNDLQIHNVLQVIGARGRAVIRTMFSHVADNTSDEIEPPYDLAPVTQTLIYSGEPRVIARFDIDAWSTWPKHPTRSWQSSAASVRP